ALWWWSCSTARTSASVPDAARAGGASCLLTAEGGGPMQGTPVPWVRGDNPSCHGSRATSPRAMVRGRQARVPWFAGDNPASWGSVVATSPSAGPWWQLRVLRIRGGETSRGRCRRTGQMSFASQYGRSKETATGRYGATNG